MITNFMWFDNQAEEAANYYVSIFPGAKITGIARYQENQPGEAGTVMTVAFEIDGTPFVALNGGPNEDFRPPGPVSFMILCHTQEEIDHYSHALARGGEQSDCGWVFDKYGFAWQITPKMLMDVQMSDDRERSARVFAAMLKMQKLDIAQLERAASAT